MHAIYGGYFMLYVQQRYFLHAHSSMSGCICSRNSWYVAKTKHINIVKLRTLLNLPKVVMIELSLMLGHVDLLMLTNGTFLQSVPETCLDLLE